MEWVEWEQVELALDEPTLATIRPVAKMGHPDSWRRAQGGYISLTISIIYRTENRLRYPAIQELFSSLSVLYLSYAKSRLNLFQVLDLRGFLAN
jgi:hypothetical protein